MTNKQCKTCNEKYAAPRGRNKNVKQQKDEDMATLALLVTALDTVTLKLEVLQAQKPTSPEENHSDDNTMLNGININTCQVQFNCHYRKTTQMK